MVRPETFALTVLLAALTALGPLTTDMYLPSLPDIAQRLHASPANVQLTISAYLVGFAVGQIVYGPLSDVHGRKSLVLAAIAIYALATLACAISTSIEMLILARAVQGVGGAGGIVLPRAIVRDLYSGARAGRELSLIATVMALAPVVAPLAGAVFQNASGWRLVFVVLLFTAAALAASVWLLLPETNTRRTGEPLSLRAIVGSFGILVRSPVYLAYLGIGAFCFAGLFAWISGSSFVLQGLYGLGPLEFGVAFAVGSAGFMVGAALSARLVTSLGLDRLIGVGAFCCALGGMSMVGAVVLGLTSALSLVLPMALYLAGMAMVLGQSIAGAMTPFPERAGAASSLFGFTQQSTSAVCGAVVGALLGSSALPLALVIAAMGCGTLVLWIATRRLRNAAKSHP